MLNMKDDNIIFVTTNKLADFARFATDWDEIASDSGADPMAECEFESTYPLVLADLKEALECVRDDKILIGRFLMSWRSRWNRHFPLRMMICSSTCWM